MSAPPRDYDEAFVERALARRIDPIGHSMIDASEARPAGVVVPLSFRPLRVSFVLRAADMREHAGEVGYPGGKVDPTDVDVRAAALREMEEEVGIPRDAVRVLGALATVPVISGKYLIHPFVVALPDGMKPRAASPEIARVVEADPMRWITGEAPIFAVRATWRGVDAHTPHFRFDSCVLYGASAYVFYELLVRFAAALDVRLAPFAVEREPPWGDRYSK